MASVSQVPLGAIPNYGGRTRWGQPADLVRRQQEPSWRLCTAARWQFCAGCCALEADRGIPCQGACAPAPFGAHPATLPPCISLPRSEGTNATHHRWGIDRVPTPKEIVEHLDQYVIGQVSGRVLWRVRCASRFLGVRYTPEAVGHRGGEHPASGHG